MLTVDDDPTLLRVIGLLLQAEGFRVLAASSAEQALGLLATELPDLVVTDLRMGGMDGMMLFDAIRKSYPMLPTIILTAHGSIAEAVDATRRGVFGFVTKPYEGKVLLAEIRKALDAGAPAPAAAAADTPVITRSPAMLSLLEEARAVAATDATVLIQGATGTGKELLAQTIHDWSSRREAPFIAVNCGAIPEALLESELFGHVKGAFTGATQDHRGLFVEAQGGTIFLDEIGDMPLLLQVKLLRVLQERQVRPVGSARSLAVDVRVVSATHRDLQAEIAAARFRQDLFYRLNVVGLALPPLGERREDIALLASRFLGSLSARYGKPLMAFSAEAMDALVRADWPGNVRQLFNVVEKCVALSSTPLVPVALVERSLERPSEEMLPFDEARRAFERDYLVQLLKLTQGNVAQAARIAQRNRSDFYSLLNRHQLEPARFKPS